MIRHNVDWQFLVTLVYPHPFLPQPMIITVCKLSSLSDVHRLKWFETAGAQPLDLHILEINIFKVYEGKGDCFVAWRYSEEALSENDP